MNKLTTMILSSIMAISMASVTFAQDAVKVETTDGGAIAAIDIAGGPGTLSRAWESVKENKWKILGAAAATIAIDRIAENNDWLWYESNATKPKSVGGDNASSASITVVDVSGDNNTVTVVAAQPQTDGTTGNTASPTTETTSSGN